MMKPTRLATALALCLGSAALPAFASSTAASSASEGVSASVGSVSTSFEKSSDASSKKDKTAAGDYKVTDVAAVAERPGTVRLTLAPVAADAKADDSFYLYVPEQVVARDPVAAGQVITAKPRAYGVEFAKADTGRAFFLVMHDAWHRELQSNAVTL
ncbi:hypothetical protein JI745_15930 [Piscinibacter sp. HJYY11]|nr:hypothetical protein [Piscinibacter sp. HJYY11]